MDFEKISGIREVFPRHDLESCSLLTLHLGRCSVFFWLGNT
jgi:hypothetical protein